MPVVGQAVNTDLKFVLVGIVIGYFWALIFTVLLAVPLFLLARRMKIVRWWSALIAGFVVGAGAISLLFPNVPSWEVAGHYGLVGAVSALVFWAIYATVAKADMEPKST